MVLCVRAILSCTDHQGTNTHFSCASGLPRAMHSRFSLRADFASDKSNLSFTSPINEVCRNQTFLSLQSDTTLPGRCLMFVAEEGNPQIEDGRLRHDQFRQALVCQQHLCVSTDVNNLACAPSGRYASLLFSTERQNPRRIELLRALSLLPPAARG